MFVHLHLIDTKDIGAEFEFLEIPMYLGMLVLITSFQQQT